MLFCGDWKKTYIAVCCESSYSFKKYSFIWFQEDVFVFFYVNIDCMSCTRNMSTSAENNQWIPGRFREQKMCFLELNIEINSGIVILFRSSIYRWLSTGIGSIPWTGMDP